MKSLPYKIVISLFIFSFNNANAQLEKIGLKEFLDNTISKKNYTIVSLEKSLSSNKSNHDILLNKAIRFKAYIDAQNFSSKLYNKNCNVNSNLIGFTNLRFMNSYEQGIENSNYLFEIAKEKEEGFSKKYSQMLNEQNEKMSSFLSFTDLECNSVLAELKMRKQGIYNDIKLGKSVLSFNYILDPVKELFDNHYQEFSSINNASNEDFYFTVSIPKSWEMKNKKSFSRSTTLGSFHAYRNFLGTSIVVSLFPKRFLSKEEMKSQNISDNDIIDFIYEDNETLTTLLKVFNLKISNNKIDCTLYNTGNNKMIFYSSFNDLGKVTGNDILKGQLIKYFGALIVKNGKVINITCGAMNNKNDFNSYNYYSKVFFKVITSIKFKNIKKNILYLTEEQNMKFIQVDFDVLEYQFLLDTGASTIVINKKILSELINNGIVSKNNYLGKDNTELANGLVITCENWLIPEMKIGNQKIKNVNVSVVDSEKSLPLFGMDGLNKLNVLKLNLSENEIILNRK